ncbi:Uncharacterised protein [Helicobacter pametensis]|uniref:hypothetical protein n=1 Tax=Eikenella sp. NML96-A-049 TaxID=1809061 RepID=UPI000FB13810|nr:hypothetical protein [Eikenella sp. NML96-A-049]VDH00785.1 Uncharacterised protein [Helicobacter pametensis]
MQNHQEGCLKVSGSLLVSTSRHWYYFLNFNLQGDQPCKPIRPLHTPPETCCDSA